VKEKKNKKKIKFISIKMDFVITDKKKYYYNVNNQPPLVSVGWSKTFLEFLNKIPLFESHEYEKNPIRKRNFIIVL